MASYLVDTNILVRAIRRRRQKWELLGGLVAAGASLGCSVITLGEVYAGMRPHEKQRTEGLFAELDLYDVTGEIARYTGLLKNE